MGKDEEGAIPGARNTPELILPGCQARTGMIFNVQNFSIQDGPGMRSTVFLKGCPFRCPWCSNPESIMANAQVKMAPEKCRTCGACVETCPTGALALSEGRVTLDITRCTQCLRCADACAYGGVTRIGSTVSAEDVLSLLMKDRIFYNRTRGGVTFSGGEPLLQPGFLLAMLVELHGHGIHTALDTTGYAPWSVFRQVLEHVDLLLFDVKHLDPLKHQAFTGVDNGLIRENLLRCAGLAEIWLRVPLIPGFNDQFSFTDRVVELARNVGASRCSFLPFHRWGEYKYARIGMKDMAARIPDFEQEKIEAFRKHYQGQAPFVSLVQT